MNVGFIVLSTMRKEIATNLLRAGHGVGVEQLLLDRQGFVGEAKLKGTFHQTRITGAAK